VLATIHGSVWYYIWISNRVVAEEAASTAAMLGQVRPPTLINSFTRCISNSINQPFDGGHLQHFNANATMPQCNHATSGIMVGAVRDAHSRPRDRASQSL